MNNTPATVLLCWETRNKRKEKTADSLCKNYTLQKLQSGCYIGQLKHYEQRELLSYFKKEFIKVTETFNIVTVCKSCYSTSSLVENGKHQKNKEGFVIF